MARQSYYELLKHPKWQEKRLAVLNRAGFTCEWCDDTETTLHVHHSHYEKGKKPWEYADRDLVCLCEVCHERAEYLRQESARVLGRLAIYSEGYVERVVAYANAILVALEAVDEPRGGYVEMSNAEEVQGVADLHGLAFLELMRYAPDMKCGFGMDCRELMALDPRRERTRKIIEEDIVRWRGGGDG